MRLHELMVLQLFDDCFQNEILKGIVFKIYKVIYNDIEKERIIRNILLGIQHGFGKVTDEREGASIGYIDVEIRHSDIPIRR